MNDRYLFKAKRIDSGEWLVGSLISMDDGEFRIATSCLIDNQTGLLTVCAYKVVPDSICQCTGLKDRNGILIWENDLVRCIDKNSDSEFYAAVKFGNPNGFYSWGYQLKRIKGDEPNLDILLWVDMEETGATIEVIGSIYDNPELLEVE